MEFLAVIDPAAFSKVVHRIALNPNEHRSGLPDYLVWKERTYAFIEVKGIREAIRDGQHAWLSWLNAEGIPARVVRVKGVAQVSAACKEAART